MIPLLQRTGPLLKLNSSGSPASNVFFLTAIFGILAVLLLWIVLVGARKGSSRPGTYSKGAFRKRAQKLKLTKEQIKLLEVIVAEMKFPNPLRVLESSVALDKLLRFAMSHLDEQEIGPEEKEFRKSVIYGIKQTIEANSTEAKVISSTRNLAVNTEVKIRGTDGATQVSYITSNIQSMIGMEATATNDPRNPYPWPKGQVLLVTFIRGGTDVYSYQTKVLGYKNVRGVFSVFTEHGKNLKQTQKRQTKRKEFSTPAVIYLVNIVETTVKRKPVRQAVVDKAKSLIGSLQDISAGGCSIMSRNALPKGSLVKIDFEPVRGKHITVYGKVRGVSPNPRNKIMHIQYTNVSRKNMNAIRDFVYEFDNPF